MKRLHWLPVPTTHCAVHRIHLPAGRFDHLFGMFLTSAGKMRRIDLIFVPKPEFAFGYLGWVRFMLHI